VVARVFKLKVKKLITVITKGQIFREVFCFIYSMPNGMVKAWPIWLSHMHILVWLKEKLRTDPKDKIISAEIPYSSSDKTP